MSRTYENEPRSIIAAGLVIAAGMGRIGLAPKLFPAVELTLEERAKLTTILAIDPGTEQSGWCVYRADKSISGSGVAKNADMLAMLRVLPFEILAIEMVASYGMAVGREVFETVRWIGRFQQAWAEPDEVRLIYRRDVKLYLCGTAAAKDPNVRQALLDLYPATGGGATPQVGTKSQPGPLYGMSSHTWPALGVALTALHAAGHAVIKPVRQADLLGVAA